MEKTAGMIITYETELRLMVESLLMDAQAVWHMKSGQ